VVTDPSTPTHTQRDRTDYNTLQLARSVINIMGFDLSPSPSFSVSRSGARKSKNDNSNITVSDSNNSNINEKCAQRDANNARWL